MKIIKVENGWDEVTTVRVRFDGFVKKEFTKVQGWLDYLEKYRPTRPKGRAKCECCGVKWEDKEDKQEWTAIVQTTKGNKILCMECFDYFGLEDT